ncbi:type II toxin-antitoxin system HigA family antitoxin [Endozoicomonas sp.]|uniref:helix-turn-helix domain-containing protein n=1 Tax=Endozoicomonas sp. TaxID=1892382 RepID=UPI0028867220|nr:hypothetical protein [Endozoicomonas sp.]
MNPHKSENLGELTRRFDLLLEVAPFLEAINHEADYQCALEATEALCNAIGDNPDDSRNLLLDMITRQIERYEYQTDPVLSQWDKQDGTIALLQTLMRQHDLKQSELPEIGSQGVVSEVLNGKRTLNLKQIQKLASRFQISAALFMGTDS